MYTFRNISSTGDLDVPDVGRVVTAGEEFEVPEELASAFAAQPANWEAVSPVAVKLAKEIAVELERVHAVALEEPAAPEVAPIVEEPAAPEVAPIVEEKAK